MRSNRKKGRDLSCPFPRVEWNDVGLLRHLEACLNLQGALEDHLRPVVAPEPAASVNFMLMTLSELLRSAGYGALMLCGHGMKLPVEMLARPLMEYLLRARYCVRYPEYAKWARHVELGRTYMALHGDEMTADERSTSFRHLSFDRNQHRDLLPDARRAQGLKPFHEITMAEIIGEVGTEDDKREYRRTSSVLHGDIYAAVVLTSLTQEDVNSTLCKTMLASVRYSLLLAERLQLTGAEERECALTLTALYDHATQIVTRHGFQIVRRPAPGEPTENGGAA